MRTHHLAAALVALSIPLPSTLSAAPKGAPTEGERADAVAALEGSQREFEELVADVADADWHRKPAPDKWSVGEVCEHLLLTERGLFGTIRSTVAGAPNPDWEEETAGKMEKIEGFMPNRGIKATAPEMVQPTGEVGRVECLLGLAAARGETLGFARTTTLPLKSYTAPHPAEFFGEMNVVQWLHFLAGHQRRHNQQMVEVRETLAIAAAEAWPWPDSLDGPIAAPESHVVLMENDLVRVMRVLISPGVKEPAHTHRRESIMITDQPARIRYWNANDEPVFESPPGPRPDGPAEPNWMRSEGLHAVENIDDHEFRAYRIELK